MKALLPHINSPKDIRNLTVLEMEQLALEIRTYIIDVISKKEGHLGASLGVVELTLAIHTVFNTPEDILVWDVGHQAYVHKIITGRRDVFLQNRDLNGISGFPKRTESEYDTFGVGHSSTSISAALGMAIASQLNGNEEKQHIAVIGDASIASGMAFEALNHAGATTANILVILNDNTIGIDKSVGALKEYLNAVKAGKNPKENNMMRSLNFNYSGPIDGHNIPVLLKEFNRLKHVKGPKFLHVVTTKGKGLKLAEADQVKYHAPGKFDAFTGELAPKSNEKVTPKFQDVFGKTLVELAALNKNIIGITPAMPSGSSLKFMMDAYPDRAFDVGIAEQHAVTLAAGMATQGKKVYCAIYSTFLQRAYDQIIHDVALQKLPVVFCIDRAGLVGPDGATHHGVFDIAYLQCIPNLIITAPKDALELRNLLFMAQSTELPFAIRYPRGRCEVLDWQKPFKTLEIGKGIPLSKGKKTAVLATGTLSARIASILKTEDKNSSISLYHFPFIKPLDYKLLDEISATYDSVLTYEEGAIKGGWGESVSVYINQQNKNINCCNFGVPDVFIEHGTVEELQQICKLDVESITHTLKQYF